MKKNWFYLFLLMVIAVMPLTSCNKNDEPKDNEEQKHDPNSDSDVIEVLVMTLCLGCKVAL